MAYALRLGATAAVDIAPQVKGEPKVQGSLLLFGVELPVELALELQPPRWSPVHSDEQRPIGEVMDHGGSARVVLIAETQDGRVVRDINRGLAEQLGFDKDVFDAMLDLLAVSHG